METTLKMLFRPEKSIVTPSPANLCIFNDANKDHNDDDGVDMLLVWAVVVSMVFAFVLHCSHGNLDSMH